MIGSPFNYWMFSLQLDDTTARPRRASKDDVYLPAITARTSNLSSLRGTLSQSCPYLYDKRRGSFSSVTSQRAAGQTKKQVTSLLFDFKHIDTSSQSQTFLLLSSCQSNLKAQREAKKSNVTVTMTYLGQGHRGSGQGSTQDELKVLQQVNGGENICVFKGLLTAGGELGE